MDIGKGNFLEIKNKFLARRYGINYNTHTLHNMYRYRMAHWVKSLLRFKNVFCECRADLSCDFNADRIRITHLHQFLSKQRFSIQIRIRDKAKFKLIGHTTFIAYCTQIKYHASHYVSISVSDPNPSDPSVFGPPGSGSWSGPGSISQRYGSGSFYHQAKIVRKTLIPTVLWLFDIYL